MPQEKKIAINEPTHEEKSLIFNFNNKKQIAFIADSVRKERGKITDKGNFLIVIKYNNNKLHHVVSYLTTEIREYMDLDTFIGILKDLGIDEKTAKRVRQEIEQRDLVISLREENFADVSKPSFGRHSARVLEERAPSAVPPLGDALPLPTSFEAAKAQVPGLRKWVEVKREAGLTSRREGFDQEVYDLMLGHLRDHQTGLGKWATSTDGMPRNLLRHVDSGLRQELYSLGNPELPPDINLPNGQIGRPQGTLDSEKRAFVSRPNQGPRKSQKEVPSQEELRDARRIIRRAERAAERLK